MILYVIKKDIINFLKMKNLLGIIIVLFYNNIRAYTFAFNFKLLSYYAIEFF